MTMRPRPTCQLLLVVTKCLLLNKWLFVTRCSKILDFKASVFKIFSLCCASKATRLPSAGFLRQGGEGGGGGFLPKTVRVAAAQLNMYPTSTSSSSLDFARGKISMQKPVPRHSTRSYS
jgi:hypothetical protein